MRLFVGMAALLAVAAFLVASEAKMAEAEVKAPACYITVSFGLNRASLSGKEDIDLPAGSYKVSTGGLTITSVSMSTAQTSPVIKDGYIQAYGPGRLSISFNGVFTGRGEQMPAEVPGGGIINKDGIELTGQWYPLLEDAATYELKAAVPGDFTAVSESEDTSYTETANGREFSFKFGHPVARISLVAARYKELSGQVDGISVYTYFFPEDEDLAKTYLDYTEKYLKMYDGLLVHYPYKRFSVVESAAATGLSMPTYTLLGKIIMRLPFVLNESLAHEIVHQWFGNSVYCDSSEGNWLEAITNYLADHHLAELKGKGWQYRKKILTDYASYVNPSNEFPLAQFQQRTSQASMAIGYGKGAMVFHMLRKMKGDDAFYKAVRKLITDNEFKFVTWDGVRKAFESVYNEDLGWFFDQWLYRKGTASIAVEDATPLVLDGTPVASFYIDQGKTPYRLDLPVSIITKKGDEKTVVQLVDPKDPFQLKAPATPQSVVFDEDYDVMRGITPDEFPPLISRLLGAQTKLLVYPDNKEEKAKYDPLIRLFTGLGFTAKSEKELLDKELKGPAILVLGDNTAVEKRLFGKAEKRGPGFVLDVRINPLNPYGVVAFASASSAEEAMLAAPKIMHYGQYSYLQFEGGLNKEKRTAESKRGEILDFPGETQGVEPAKALGLNEIIEKISGSPVIFIGEQHTNYEDHKVELDVIKALHEKGKKIAVGMEMFQTPYQPVLDDYIAGKISEREFLKKSEYFSRWIFNYDLYREILEYARANHIPVVALNIKSEIVDKVAKGGLDALTPQERKALPADMDMSNMAYRKRLWDVYESHPGKISFSNFYQSQVIWDETMARSAASFITNNPGVQLIVLAGVGHVMYSDGIPDRLKRRTGKDYATLINGTYDKGIGNYVLFPAHMDTPEPPKLGIYTEEKDGGLVVKSVQPGSPASKAGIEASDKVVEVGGWKISDFNDVRIAMFDKLPGQVVKVRVIRKKLFPGESTLDLYVTL